jgi:AsmA protein
MQKYLKFLLITLIISIIACLIAVGILVKWVSPNRFKPLIASEVLKRTGRQLTIDGHLSWEFFPYLGVRVGHMMLTNPVGFDEKVFLEINNTKIGVKVFPLLTGHIESSGIVLEGVHLNLLKNATGKVNWSFAKPDSESTHATEAANQTVAIGDKNPQKMTFTVDIPNVDLTNAHITYSDEQSRQHIDLDKLELHARNVSMTKPFAVSSAFNFAINPGAKVGEVKFDGMISLDLDKQLYQVDRIYAVIKTPNGKEKLSVGLGGEIIANLKSNTLAINHFEAHVANLIMQGAMNVSELQSAPVVSGRITIPAFNLKELLQTIKQDSPSLTIAKEVKGDFSFSFAANNQATTALQKLKLKGSLNISEIETNNVVLTKLTIPTQLDKGVLTLAGINAAMYEGDLNATATVDLNAAVAPLSLNAKLININLKTLLSHLQESDSQLKVRGLATVAINITSAGFASDALLGNLNGTANTIVKNGVLEGINIGYLADSAYALARREPVPAKTTDETDFGILSASAVIQKGVLTNNDLYVDSPRFETKGQGQIDLPKSEIDYQLQIVSKEAAQDKRKNVLNIYNLTIPVRITGNLKSPSVRVDAGDIAKQVAKQQIQHLEDNVKNKINDKLKDVLKDKLPADAGELLKNLLGN